MLFVSHNMAAIKTYARKGWFWKLDVYQFIGDASKAISIYLKAGNECMNFKIFTEQYTNDDFALREISINPKGESADTPLDEYQEIEINIKIEIKKLAERRKVTFVLNDETGNPIFTFSHLPSGVNLVNGFNHLKCFLPKGFLNVGSYYLSFYLIEDSKETIFVEKDIISFEIQEGARNIGGWMGKEPGIIKPVFNWQNLIDLEKSN